MNLPPDSLDSAWVALPAPARMNRLDKLVYEAADISGMLRILTIGGVKRIRVVRLFYEALLHPAVTGISSLNRITKEDLFIRMTIARLHGATLPAPLDYFAP